MCDIGRETEKNVRYSCHTKPLETPLICLQRKHPDWLLLMVFCFVWVFLCNVYLRITHDCSLGARGFASECLHQFHLSECSASIAIINLGSTNHFQGRFCMRGILISWAMHGFIRLHAALTWLHALSGWVSLGRNWMGSRSQNGTVSGLWSSCIGKRMVVRENWDKKTMCLV